MNQKKNYKNGGFIQITLIIVGTLVVIKYIYDIDIVGMLTEGQFKTWLDKIYSLGTEGWEKYKDVIIRIWDLILDFVQNILSKLKK